MYSVYTHFNCYSILLYDSILCFVSYAEVNYEWKSCFMHVNRIYYPFFYPTVCVYRRRESQEQLERDHIGPGSVRHRRLRCATSEARVRHQYQRYIHAVRWVCYIPIVIYVGVCLMDIRCFMKIWTNKWTSNTHVVK